MLRRVYAEVSQSLEARSASRYMFQCNAITMDELQSIQSLSREPIRAARRLLDIVEDQSEYVFSRFLESLKQTGQQHVYESIVSGSYNGTSGIHRAA